MPEEVLHGLFVCALSSQHGRNSYIFAGCKKEAQHILLLCSDINPFVIKQIPQIYMN